MTTLSEAQELRRDRLACDLDRRIDEVLDRIGLSEEKIALAPEDVTPDERKKLKGILKRLAQQKNPFTQCMRDLRKHKPEWSEDRRKRTCGTLKAIIKGTGRVRALSEDGSCALIDDGVADLLAMADVSILDEEVEVGTT